jgi:hypothetical protein
LCAARTAVIWAWNVVLPPLWAGHATGVAPGEGLGPSVALGLDVGVGGGVVGDGRASVWVGVGAALVRAADEAGGVTATGVQPATAIRVAAHNRRKRSFTLSPSLTESMRCVDNPYKQPPILYADRTAK